MVDFFHTKSPVSNFFSLLINVYYVNSHSLATFQHVYIIFLVNKCSLTTVKPK